MLRLLSRVCKDKAPSVYDHLSTVSTALYSTMGARRSVNPTQPTHWILDWDGTITRRDTLDALVSIAASSKPDSPILDKWKSVSEDYVSDYTAAMEKLAPGGELPKDVQGEKVFLQALSSVEQASLDRVSSSGIFAGLTRKLIDEGANDLVGTGKIELRNGVLKFLRYTQSRDHDDLDILSVNWSRHFIHSCLRAGTALVDQGTIYANELDGIERNLTSMGKISPEGDAEMHIISSGDKLEYLVRLRKHGCEFRNVSLDLAKQIIYIGDSWTDIESLLEADLGICIRDDPIGSSQKKLAQRLEDLGIHCPHLQDWREADAQQVVWARDFAEVQEWVEVHNTRKA